MLLGLLSDLVCRDDRAAACRHRAVKWLLGAQNVDGGWGASGGVASSLEDTGVVLAALGRAGADGDGREIATAVARGAAWLTRALDDDAEIVPSPLGLYFARLWYFEALYPLVFAVEGLAAARALLISNPDQRFDTAPTGVGRRPGSTPSAPAAGETAP